MEFYVENRNPARDLGGLCECFISESENCRDVAPFHVHQYFEVLFCLDGSYKLCAGQYENILHKGDIAMIHPMEPHHTQSLEPGLNRYLVLKFTPEALYSANMPLYELKYIFPYLHFSERKAYVYPAEPVLEGLLYKILEERQKEEYGYEMAVRAYVSEVLLWFLRAWHQKRNTDFVDERTLMKLQRTIQYIDGHLEDGLRAKDVAEAMGMGLSTFSRFFASAAGMSFPTYIRLKRLNWATILLAEGEKTITEIAVETGFSTASYLILCFREQYGITPSRFRKLYASGQKRSAE